MSQEGERNFDFLERNLEKIADTVGGNAFVIDEERVIEIHPDFDYLFRKY